MCCMARVAACEFHRPGQFWRAVVVLLRLLCIVSSHLGGEPQRGVKALFVLSVYHFPTGIVGRLRARSGGDA
jgi:hypothetical protein